MHPWPRGKLTQDYLSLRMEPHYCIVPKNCLLVQKVRIVVNILLWGKYKNLGSRANLTCEAYFCPSPPSWRILIGQISWNLRIVCHSIDCLKLHNSFLTLYNFKIEICNLSEIYSQEVHATRDGQSHIILWPHNTKRNQRWAASTKVWSLHHFRLNIQKLICF